MLMRVILVLGIGLFCGCGGGSDKADVKVKGVARTEALAQDDSISAIKVLNVPALADYEVTGEQLAKANAAQTCISMPQIAISTAHGAPKPVLTLLGNGTGREYKYAKLKARDLKGTGDKKPALKTLTVGPSGGHEVVMSRTEFFGEIFLSNIPAEPIALEIHSSKAGDDRYEGCLIISHKLVAAEPIVRFSTVARGTNVVATLGIETIHSDALQVHVTNPNSYAITVSFNSIAVDSLSNQPLKICHRADPDPHGKCSAAGNHEVSLAAGGSTSFGIKGAIGLETKTEQNRFRTVGVRVQFNTYAALIYEPRSFQFSHAVDLY